MLRAPLRLISLLILTFPLLPAQQTIPKFDLLDRNIVKVRVHRNPADGEPASDETGTGIVLSINPGVVRILTAAHVVRGAASVNVSFVTDKVSLIPAKVLPNASDAVDLAMLEVALPRGAHIPDKFLIFESLPNSSLHQAEHVWTVNGDWDPVPNTVVHLAHQANPQQFEYTRTSLGEGYSGGPVFDDGGHLIGIHISDTGRGDYSLGVAVKIEAALETLEALQYTRSSLNGVVVAASPERQPAIRNDQTANSSPRAPQTRQMWRNLNNNQLYQIRAETDRIYISQPNGNIVADLALKADKNGVKKYIGNSALSSCPGSGYMELVNISGTRIEGRVELKPTGNNVKCGGVFGMMRQLGPIAFIPEASH